MDNRGLLLAFLALQNDFINRMHLIEVVSLHLSDKKQAIPELLIGRGYLTEESRKLLESLVDHHMRQHGGDVERSIASLSNVSSLVEELSQLSARQEGGQDASHFFSTILPKDITSEIPARIDSGEDGRFKVIREHARGGLGVVYVAEDVDLKRNVALKKIRTELASNPILQQKFVREATVTGRLEHPGIVPIYAFGANREGNSYYAMRFIRGETLRATIQAIYGEPAGSVQPTLPQLKELVRRFLDIANAMEYAHHRGVIHRDLKPGNIMIGRHGETLVVDWGLSKVLDKNDDDALDPLATTGIWSEVPMDRQSFDSNTDTRQGEFLGTLAYAPPEQLRGDVSLIGPASDVYSLGAVLFEILTGRSPMPKVHSIQEAIANIEEGRIPHPTQFNPKTPFGLNAICVKSMQAKPHLRYQSAGALALDVRAWLDDLPVSAAKEPLPLRIQRWARNHPRWTAASLTAVVVCTFGLATHSTLMSSKNRELQTAYAKQDHALNLAMKTVDSVLVNYAVDPRATQEGMAESQRDSMEAASKQYNDLLTVFEGEPKLVRELVRSLRLLSLTEANMGKLKWAMDHATRAEGLWNKISNQTSSELLEQAQLHRLIGYIHFNQKNSAKSKEAHEKGIELINKLLKAEPNNVHYQLENAIALTYLGEAFVAETPPSRDLLEKAKQQFSASEKAFASIPQERYSDLGTPGDPEPQIYFRAMNLFNLAMTEHFTGKTSVGLKHGQESIDLMNGLSKRHPRNATYRSRQLRAILNLSTIKEQIGDMDAVSQLALVADELSLEIWSQFRYSLPIRSAAANVFFDSLRKGYVKDPLQWRTILVNLGEILVAYPIADANASPEAETIAQCVTDFPDLMESLCETLKGFETPDQLSGAASLGQCVATLKQLRYVDSQENQKNLGVSEDLRQVARKNLLRLELAEPLKEFDRAFEEASKNFR